jgi:hypothetical protein
MPALNDDGHPLVFDDAGDELFEDEKYDPQTLEYALQLWRPAALEGHAYHVGESPLGIRGHLIEQRRAPDGGTLARYLLPHVVELEKDENPNAKGSQAWGWLPPPLLGEGKKVQPDWLHNYLLDPYPIRPASFLRMPKYDLSADEARALVDYFAARDNADYPYEFLDRRSRSYLQTAEQAYQQQLASAPGDPSAARSRFDDALRILTDKNYCITCHVIGDFVPKTSDRAKAPNLAEVHKRLRSDYVHRWIAHPVSVLPYTGMPVVIPYRPGAEHSGGVDQSLYHGTSVQQLDAVVDLLMNFDVYSAQRSGVARMIQSAAPSPPNTNTD